MRVFVTGGTGFLGKALVRELAKENKVSLLARSTSKLSGLEKLDNVEIFLGDVCDKARVEKAMRGCSAVFHLAALVSAWAPKEKFWEVNVQGLENVAAAALKQKVKKLVYVSSFLALGNSDNCPGRVCAESKKHSGHYHNEYERTKHLALLRAEELAKQEGLPVVTVIPGLVYGGSEARESNYFGKWLKAFKEDSTITVPGNGEQKGCFAFREDIVKGIMLAWKKGRVGEKYILGGENISLNRFVAAMEQAGKRNARVRHVPFLALKLIALIAEAKAHITGRKPALTRHEVEVFRHNWGYSSEKAGKELGYRIIPIKESIKKTLD